MGNSLYRNKHEDCFLSPDVKNALNNICNEFKIVEICKTIGTTSLVFKRSYVSVIAKDLKLGLNNIYLQIFAASSITYLKMVALIKI